MAVTSKDFSNYGQWLIYQAIIAGGTDVSGLATEATLEIIKGYLFSTDEGSSVIDELININSALQLIPQKGTDDVVINNGGAGYATIALCVTAVNTYFSSNPTFTKINTQYFNDPQINLGGPTLWYAIVTKK